MKTQKGKGLNQKHVSAPDRSSMCLWAECRGFTTFYRFVKIECLNTLVQHTGYTPVIMDERCSYNWWNEWGTLSTSVLTDFADIRTETFRRDHQFQGWEQGNSNFPLFKDFCQPYCPYLLNRNTTVWTKQSKKNWHIQLVAHKWVVVRIDFEDAR